MTALCSDCIVPSPLPAGGSQHGIGGALANFPAFRLSGLLACWFFGVVADAGGGGGLPRCWLHGSEVASAGQGGRRRCRGCDEL